MQITLVESEIETALRNFVQDQGLNIEDKSVSIDFRATRGPNGYTAELTISNPSAAEEAKPTPAPAPSKRNLGVANKVSAARSAPANTNTADAEPADKPPFETDEATPEPAATAAADEAPAVESTSSKPSIFAALKKPTNPKPEADAA